MITVKIPNNNFNERKYILDIIFKKFLSLDFKVENGFANYEIILENQNKLIIEDHFFNKFPKDLEYLKEENVPKKIEFCNDDFIVGKNIPVIYGTPKLKIKNAKLKTVECGVDIFAASFFMLTRWEEYVKKIRDEHNRFPASESLAYKEGFLGRPIVNEYVEWLKQALLKLDTTLKFKKKKFQLVLTHDVDELYMWKGFKHVFRVVTGDIAKRRNLKLALERIRNYLLIKKGELKDPYDTFNRIMEISENLGLKSHFYFMSGGSSKFDNRYNIKDPKTLQIIQEIQKRGHIIGIHASYNSYKNKDMFAEEKKILENIIKDKIKEGRQHYLRFEIPYTWQVWEDNGMEVDSSCVYAEKEGFRCGTDNEFNVFNILTRKKLNLKERPLIVMDKNLFGYQKLSYDTAMKRIEALKKQTKLFTLLWHNSSVEYLDFYEKLLERTLCEKLC